MSSIFIKGGIINDYYLGKKLEQLCIKIFDRNNDRIKKSLVKQLGL